MREYHRRVLTYLRNEYGVCVEVQSGTNHNYLDFEYSGKARRLLLHRSNSMNKANTLALKLQDIRRELGPPPEKTDVRPKRRLEDMMPEIFNPLPLAALAEPEPSSPIKKKETAARGTVSNYQSNGCIRFSFPSAVVECLDTKVRYKVARTGVDSWELGPGGNSGIRIEGNLCRVNASSRNTSLAGDLGYFNSFPADYIAVDGHLLVSIVERRSLRSPIQHDVAKPRPVSNPQDHDSDRSEPIKHVDPTSSPEIQIRNLRRSPNAQVDRMRALLTELKELEAAGPYRLVKNKDGVWMFQAPSIKLEDEG